MSTEPSPAIEPTEATSVDAASPQGWAALRQVLTERPSRGQWIVAVLLFGLGFGVAAQVHTTQEDALAAAGKFDQPDGDIALRGRRLAAAFSGIFEFGPHTHPAQDVGVHQRIVDDDIAVLQGVVAHERHEARRAGPGAGEPHPARLERRKRLVVKAREALCLFGLGRPRAD